MGFIVCGSWFTVHSECFVVKLKPIYLRSLMSVPLAQRDTTAQIKDKQLSGSGLVG